MPNEDRQKWNARYAEGDEAWLNPSSLLTSLDGLLPRNGRALDVAGGVGRHAVWLAMRGLDVTLADISEVGLEIARRRAARMDVRITTVAMDLEVESLPAGPWDLILSAYFLWRPLFREYAAELRPGGLLVVIHPTQSNLKQDAKPSRGHLLNDGELPSLVSGLEILRYEEGRLDEGRHVAFLVAVRPEAVPHARQDTR